MANLMFSKMDYIGNILISLPNLHFSQSICGKDHPLFLTVTVNLAQNGSKLNFGSII